MTFECGSGFFARQSDSLVSLSYLNTTGTDSTKYMLSLVDHFPNSCVPIEKLRKLRDREKKLRKRIEDKKNKPKASEVAVIQEQKKAKKSTSSMATATEMKSNDVPASTTSNSTSSNDGPLRSFFYMDPPLFNPNDFIEENDEKE